MRKKCNKATGRDYSYDTKYESSEEQKNRRVKRNKDRRKALRAGRVHKNDGKDVHHSGHKNLTGARVVSSSYNRSIK